MVVQAEKINGEPIIAQEPDNNSKKIGKKTTMKKNRPSWSYYI